MNKEEALSLLKCFKSDGISRDKMIELYNFFRYNPEENSYTLTLTGGESVLIKRTELWNVVNTSDIREVWKTGNKIFNKDEEYEDSVIKLRKEKLGYSDKLKFERSVNTKNLRNLNTLEELNKEVIESLRKIPKIQSRENVISNTENGVGIIVLSDLHFNELIDIPSNKYDFEVASKRLKKLSNRAKNYFKQNGVTDVVITLLGDVMNSDRRQSEVFNMATNRSRAMVLAFHLLRQFISDISNVANVVVASVSGNESRVIGEDFDTSDILVTYNYDYTIHQFLKVAFECRPDIKFIDGDFAEKVLNINGSNVLITHGVNLKNDLSKSVQQTFGRYSSNGINLDYLLCGHLHENRIGDTCARCGSLCGGNSYSEGALNLQSRASQMIGIFYPDKTNEMLRVDLQNTDNVDGYNIIQELEEYNIKSANKKHKFFIHNI